MAASTIASLPIDAYSDGAGKSAMLALNLECEMLFANSEWVGASGNTGALGAIGGGSNCNYTIYTACVAGDLWDRMWHVPKNLDRTKPIYAQVLFTGSATSSKSATFLVTYNPLAVGDDADIAPVTALDATIPAKSAADVDVLAETYVGVINGDALDADEEYIMWRCELDGADSVTDWGFAGMKVYYHKAFA